MFEMRYDDRDNLKDEIIETLRGRRNLMVYDGIRDGLDENVDYRFFYSSPGDALEFVVGDIFRSSVDIEFKGRNIECFGKVKIIREPKDYREGFVECLFGMVTTENIKVRAMDKVDIVLNLNFYGIERINEAIEYFEKFFCVKDTD